VPSEGCRCPCAVGRRRSAARACRSKSYVWAGSAPGGPPRCDSPAQRYECHGSFIPINRKPSWSAKSRKSFRFSVASGRSRTRQQARDPGGVHRPGTPTPLGSCLQHAPAHRHSLGVRKRNHVLPPFRQLGQPARAPVPQHLARPYAAWPRRAATAWTGTPASGRPELSDLLYVVQLLIVAWCVSRELR
jgi:hypothetical protein